MRIHDVVAFKLWAGYSHTRVHGLPVTIEVKKGQTRQLRNDKGKVVYERLMKHDYGYIGKTTGRDGDEVDAFVGPIGDKAQEVYVVHMKDLGPDVKEREDEDKVFLGFPTAEAAKASFLAHYPETFYEGMTTLPVSLFKKKLQDASKSGQTDRKIHARRRQW
jgi:hypothetical protein